jgi:lysophospholipase L1-like esterase
MTYKSIILASVILCTVNPFIYACTSDKDNLSDSCNMKKKCFQSSFYGKNTAVFGGSLSVNPESMSGKKIWKEYLNISIKDYGVGGYGFSSLQGSVQNQVDNSAIHDIYILWASTNDYTNNREPGKVSDYTSKDHYNEKNRKTQCGGINYCVKKIREKNSKAIILFFTSLPCFINDGCYKENSSAHNSLGYNLYDYVKLQKECCKYNHIKYLDQWGLKLFNENNYRQYYKSDKLHLTESGYKLLALYQISFFIK